MAQERPLCEVRIAAPVMQCTRTVLCQKLVPLHLVLFLEILDSIQEKVVADEINAEDGLLFLFVIRHCVHPPVLPISACPGSPCCRDRKIAHTNPQLKYPQSGIQQIGRRNSFVFFASHACPTHLDVPGTPKVSENAEKSATSCVRLNIIRDGARLQGDFSLRGLNCAIRNTQCTQGLGPIPASQSGPLTTGWRRLSNGWWSCAR